MPFSPNARHVRGVAGERSFAGSVAWYRTTVIVPRAGVYAIRFESVNHRATVWVDGRLAAAHTGTYLPFEARVRLAGGAHTLVVRADWRDPAAMKADAWHRTWFNFGGINRPVSIRALGASELDSPSIVTRLRRHRRGGRPRGRRHQPRRPADHRRARDARGRPRCASRRSSSVAAQRATVRARVRIARPNLWEPGHPTLETLRLEVPGEAAFTARVGLREVRWAGGRLELNGEPLKLRGASLQEDAPGRGDALTDADADAIVARLKAIGANATRSQHPLSDALLDRLDAAGILVWQGVGPVDAPGRVDLAHARAAAPRDPPRAPERRCRRACTPACVAWNLANEVAGNGHYGGQPEYVDARRPARAPPRSRAPDRASTCGARTCPTAPASCTATSTPSAPRTTRAGTTTRSRRRPPCRRASTRWLARLHATFPGKVLIVSEFGAEANTLNAPGTPGLRELPVAACSPATSAPTRRPRGSTASSSGTSQDFALAPSFAGGSIRRQVPEHQPRARDQPEGPVHLRRAARSRRSRRCAGRSGAEPAVVVVASVVRVASWRCAALTAASREGGGGGGAAAPPRRRFPARSLCALRAVLQHLPRAARGWAV